VFACLGICGLALHDEISNVVIHAQKDLDNLPEVHRNIDHYKANHRGTPKFAALYELLILAGQVVQSRQGADAADK